MSEPTLLIVDDNPENLTVLGQLLRSADFPCRVRIANSGPTALRLAVTPPIPDLILLDVMMPGMDGHEVLRRLRTEPVSAEIPVIFVTAMDAADDEVHGLTLGAADYLTKPLVPPVVLARVRTQLALKAAQDRLKNQNANLEAEVARRMVENQRVQNAAIHALARLAETRDTETGNHLRRTQAYVRRLGEQVRQHPRFASLLDDRAIDLMARSAPLHDIGKVGIPDHVLLKPGKLDAHEWEVMKHHAALGAEAIERAELDADQPIDFLACAKDIARHHHERWDGSGYPDGLAGDAIPLSARLMAIADVFDALTSRRVYKAAMSCEQARELMAKEHGRHFDPDLLDAFLTDFPAFCEIADRYADSEAELVAKHASMHLPGPAKAG